MVFVSEPVVSLAPILGGNTVLKQTVALRKYLQGFASAHCQLQVFSLL